MFFKKKNFSINFIHIFFCDVNYLNAYRDTFSMLCIQCVFATLLNNDDGITIFPMKKYTIINLLS